MSKVEVAVVAYSNATKDGIKQLVRATQMMSIFGANDRRSDFFSEFFPLFTA